MMGRLSEGCRVQVSFDPDRDEWVLHCKQHGDSFLKDEHYEGDRPTMDEVVMYANRLGCIHTEVAA